MAALVKELGTQNCVGCLLDLVQQLRSWICQSGLRCPTTVPYNRGMTEVELRAGSRWLTWGRTFVGGVVVGLAVNAVSDAYKGAGAAAVAGGGFLVALVAVELRRFPAQAPVQGLVSQVSLAGAAAAAFLSLVAPAPWRPWAVLVAAALALTSCL